VEDWASRRDAVVVALGEPLLRLSVPRGDRLATTDQLDLHVGGAEANVVAALAALGVASRFVGAVPDSALGDRVVGALRSAGVETTTIERRRGSRLGLYFVEQAGAPRGHQVWYDRAGSAICELDTVPSGAFDRAGVAVLSGITPALGPGPAALADQFVAAARDHGAAVVIDVNHRQRLWSAATAREALLPLLAEADLVVCAERDARTVFGAAGDASEVAATVRTLAPCAGIVAITCDQPGVVMATAEGSVHVAGTVADDVDRFGAGDAFVAGLLHGLLDGASVADAAARGLTLSALARTVRGDFTLFRADELRAVATTAGELVR
jgi:2-dehydro-3-deoxygluconokinase